MSIRLRWIASGSASCFHAVRRLSEGHAATLPEVGAALAAPTAELQAFLTVQRLPSPLFFGHLVPTAIGVESNRELATAVLGKTAGRERAAALAESLAGILTACEQAYFRNFPKLVDELELRSRPLRELWEGHGPGVLTTLGRATDRRLLVEEATVAVVLPYSGGGGGSHAAYNSVTIEAVLANPHGQLPETIRLAWLLAALNVDLPDVAEQFGPGRAETVLRLALVPAVLDAAAELELVRTDDKLLATALEVWEAPQPAGDRTGEIVCAWWNLKQSNGTKWPIAVAALEQLLYDAR
jgi:hypothetical protein